MPKLKGKSNVAANVNNDGQKTVEQWLELSRETLKIKCNALALIETGTKTSLAKRLYEYYNGKTDDEADINTILTEMRRLSSIVENIQQQNTRSTTELTVTDQTQQPTATVADPNIFTAPDRIQQPITVADPNQQTLRREAETVQVQINSTQPQQEQQQIPINPVYLLDQQIEHQQQPPQLLPQTQSQGTDLLFPDTNFLLPPPPTANPFKPPAIPLPLLKQAENLSYVDLDTLLPQHSGYFAEHERYLTIGTDGSDNFLLKPKSPKSKIKSLNDWMYAWNLYMQATLSAHPQLFFELFSYQKLFCSIARKYNFDFCYMYDKAHRTNIATQTKLSAHERTIWWHKLDDDLYNSFLRENQLPTCYICKLVGHFASNCPSGKKTTQIHNMSYTPRNSATFPSTTNTLPPFRAPQTPARVTQSPQSRPQTPTTQNYPSSEINIVCTRFNKTGRCFKPPCRYQHVCERCLSHGHPGFQCRHPPPAPQRN